MALAESVPLFLRQVLMYVRLTSNSSCSLCSVKLLALLPQPAKCWSCRCVPLFLASWAVFRAVMKAGSCPVHLVFVSWSSFHCCICSIDLTSGDDGSTVSHRSLLKQVSQCAPNLYLPCFPLATPRAQVYRSSWATPALTPNSGGWRACLCEQDQSLPPKTLPKLDNLMPFASSSWHMLLSVLFKKRNRVGQLLHFQSTYHSGKFDFR